MRVRGAATQGLPSLLFQILADRVTVDMGIGVKAWALRRYRTHRERKPID